MHDLCSQPLPPVRQAGKNYAKHQKSNTNNKLKNIYRGHFWSFFKKNCPGQHWQLFAERGLWTIGLTISISTQNIKECFRHISTKNFNFRPLSSPRQALGKPFGPRVLYGEKKGQSDLLRTVLSSARIFPKRWNEGYLCFLSPPSQNTSQLFYSTQWTLQ